MGRNELLGEAAVLRSMSDGLIVLDAQQRIKTINPAAAALLALDGTSYLERPLGELPGGPELLSSGALVERGGRLLWVDCAPIDSSEGRQAGMVLTLRNADGLARALLRAPQSRSYIGSVLHDLAKYLSVMRASSELLLVAPIGELSAQQRDMIGKIKANALRQSHLLNAITDLYHLDAGLFELRSEEFELTGLLDELNTRYAPSFSSAGVSLEWSAPRRPLPVYADPGQVARVLSSLLDNALDYTPAGGRVLVRADHRQGQTSVEVEDSGGGISLAEQPQIFKRFFRGQRPAAVSQQRLGLSLAIAKALIELQQGDLWFESIEGRGSTFGLALPTSSRNRRPAQERMLP